MKNKSFGAILLMFFVFNSYVFSMVSEEEEQANWDKSLKIIKEVTGRDDECWDVLRKVRNKNDEQCISILHTLLEKNLILALPGEIAWDIDQGNFKFDTAEAFLQNPLVKKAFDEKRWLVD